MDLMCYDKCGHSHSDPFVQCFSRDLICHQEKQEESHTGIYDSFEHFAVLFILHNARLTAN
jgi:hypothetical protein